ncbi:hypothetical protein H5410_056895 [Solanum commersonii]|uniref:Uncharacterized protein n=1 Tax=Solanum commersonii TaxID=4109 RepID=A0A9J5WLG2_SOLCO|nr:hypothetical protein H5410_056895 [Solanum commersonii]
MTVYLDTRAYIATSYKYRMHYEIILSSTDVNSKDFYPANTKKVYNFSKLVVKRIISPEEWGMSTLKELDYIHPEQKVPFSIPWIMRWSIEVNTTRKASHAYKECSTLNSE